MKNNVVFGERLAQAMKGRGLTQAKLGELMSVNQTTISRWLSGKREPDYRSLLLLCAFLDESPNELLGYEESDCRGYAFEEIKRLVLSDVGFQEKTSAVEREIKDRQLAREQIDRIFKAKFKEYCEQYGLRFDDYV